MRRPTLPFVRRGGLPPRRRRPLDPLAALRAERARLDARYETLGYECLAIEDRLDELAAIIDRHVERRGALKLRRPRT